MGCYGVHGVLVVGSDKSRRLYSLWLVKFN